jgi:hypothetical protein
MPIPKPNQGENKDAFITRCMSNETMKEEYPTTSQRFAVCTAQVGSSGANILARIQEAFDHVVKYDDEYGFAEDLCIQNLVIPEDSDYVDVDEEVEEVLITSLLDASSASEYQGRKVTLNKPFRTPKGPKKFSVYVKNEKGNVVKVNFGDPNMKIKKNIPERRRSFRARHNCDNPGPKWKARYWSCKMW